MYLTLRNIISHEIEQVRREMLRKQEKCCNTRLQHKFIYCLIRKGEPTSDQTER